MPAFAFCLYHVHLIGQNPTHSTGFQHRNFIAIPAIAKPVTPGPSQYHTKMTTSAVEFCSYTCKEALPGHSTLHKGQCRSSLLQPLVWCQVYCSSYCIADAQFPLGGTECNIAQWHQKQTCTSALRRATMACPNFSLWHSMTPTRSCKGSIR